MVALAAAQAREGRNVRAQMRPLQEAYRELLRQEGAKDLVRGVGFASSRPGDGMDLMKALNDEADRTGTKIVVYPARSEALIGRFRAAGFEVLATSGSGHEQLALMLRRPSSDTLGSPVQWNYQEVSDPETSEGRSIGDATGGPVWLSRNLPQVEPPTSKLRQSTADSALEL